MIKYYTLLLSLFLFITANSQAFRDSILLEEDFHDTASFTDLSKKLIWGENTEVESGFQYGEITDSRGLVHQAIHITEEATQYAGYQPNTIRASQAVDFRFPNMITRTTDTLIIEFDALWDSFNSSGWGESGRIVLTLLHDYPEEEIPFGAIDNLSAESPFGRPAYNLRLRNTDQTGPYQSGSFMLYGGGHDIEGEIERANGYWLPGFSSEAGGGTPGQGPPYPQSPTAMNEALPVASISHWRHYTWVIAPERLSFYMRDALAPEEENELVLFMEIPRSNQWKGDVVQQMNEAHGTHIMEPPALYHWFGELEALRLYFRGVQQAYLANLQIRHIYESEVVAYEEARNENSAWLFPNPATEQITLRLNSPLKKAAIIRLLNAGGQNMRLFPAGKGASTFSLPVSGLPRGPYILQLAARDIHFTQKIILR